MQLEKVKQIDHEWEEGKHTIALTNKARERETDRKREEKET